MESEAYEAVNNIKGEFDGIFIGGSGGNIDKIIYEYGKMLKPQGKMVLNFITISNLYKAMEVLKENGYEVEVSQIAVSRGREKKLYAYGK